MPSQWLRWADRNTLISECCFQSVYSNHTRPTRAYPANCTPYFRDFHTYIAAFNSPQQMSPEKRHWKTATDGATPLQPLSQAKPRLAHPRGLSYSSGYQCETRQLDHSLCVCLQICYSLIAMPSQHQHHAPPCLNAPNLALSKSVKAAGPLLSVHATSLVSTCLLYTCSGFRHVFSDFVFFKNKKIY